jgi:hypothetical protein
LNHQNPKTGIHLLFGILPEKELKLLFGITKDLLYLLFTITLVSSCIEKFSPSLNKSDLESRLVVECTITDEPGPFKVHLTKSGPIDKLYNPEPFKDADVMIIDDKGNNYQLIDNQNGWYETLDKQLKGITGNTYTLNITTVDGIQYESLPVLMSEMPDIDSLYFEEVKQMRFEDGLTFEDNWLNILVDTKDTTGQIKYWKWDFEETWEVMIPTDSLLIQHGWDATIATFTVENVNIDPAKKVCWVTVPSRSIHIESTAKNPVNEIRRKVINSIGPGGDKLLIKYSILVRQTALSEDIYSFWKKLQEANEGSGSMYDRIPSQVFGNISRCDGTGKALGYFSATVVRTKRIFIDSYEHKIKTISPYNSCFYLTEPSLLAPRVYFGTIDKHDGEITYKDDVYTFYNFCNDCREYGTNVKPDFW